jgi:hypothetical protein
MSQPVIVAIEPTPDRVPSVSLFDWVQRDPAYRGTLRAEHRPPEPGSLGTGQIVLVGLLGPGSVLGLFRLVRAWLELQRSTAVVRVTVDGTEVNVELDGRFDPEEVAARLLDRAVREAGGREPGSR